MLSVYTIEKTGFCHNRIYIHTKIEFLSGQLIESLVQVAQQTLVHHIKCSIYNHGFALRCIACTAFISSSYFVST